MGFSRQEYWSGLPFPTPGHLPLNWESSLHLLRLLHWQADSLPLSHQRTSIHIQFLSCLKKKEKENTFIASVMIKVSQSPDAALKTHGDLHLVHSNEFTFFSFDVH